MHNIRRDFGIPMKGNICSNVGVAVKKADHSLFCQNSYRTLFVRNLPFHFQDIHLRNLVASKVDDGDSAVEQCRVKYSSKNGKTLQVGIVMLRTVAEAKQALEKLQTLPRICGRILLASEFDPSSERIVCRNEAIHFSFEAFCVEPLITEGVIFEQLETFFGTVDSVCLRGHYFHSSSQSGYGFFTLMDSSKHELVYRAERACVPPVEYHFRKLRSCPLQTSSSSAAPESTINSSRSSSFQLRNSRLQDVQLGISPLPLSTYAFPRNISMENAQNAQVYPARYMPNSYVQHPSPHLPTLMIQSSGNIIWVEAPTYGVYFPWNGTEVVGPGYTAGPYSQIPFQPDLVSSLPSIAVASNYPSNSVEQYGECYFPVGSSFPSADCSLENRY